MYTLVTRSAVAAVDGAPVAATSIYLPKMYGRMLVSVKVTTPSAPAAFNFRAAVEASMDDSTWDEVVRFIDITAVGFQIFRAGAASVAGSSVGAASDLTGAAAAAVVADTPWPRYLRAVTMLQAMSGGVAPTVTAVVTLDVG